MGSEGGNEEQILLSTPTSVAIDHADNIYVLDAGNALVQVFETFEGAGGSENCQPENPVRAGVCLVTKWPVTGTMGISVDSQGNVYVADLSSFHKFTKDGTLLYSFGDCRGPDVCGIVAVDLAVGIDDNVYVADQEFKVIRKFTSDGQFLADIGSWWHPQDFQR